IEFSVERLSRNSGVQMPKALFPPLPPLRGERVGERGAVAGSVQRPPSPGLTATHSPRNGGRGQAYSPIGLGIRCVCTAILLWLPQLARADEPTPESKLFSAMKYRLVGPFRGGRSCAVTGVPGKPLLFYFGATGGGVWRTTDGGSTWTSISDGFFGGSIGS